MVLLFEEEAAGGGGASTADFEREWPLGLSNRLRPRGCDVVGAGLGGMAGAGGRDMDRRLSGVYSTGGVLGRVTKMEV